MESQSGLPPFHSFSDRLAEMISKTIKVQMAKSASNDVLKPTLEQMVEQQQQANAQLGHLVTAVSQLNERVQENTQCMERSAAPHFWKKMALEVPPVVLAVLLAFGINSWWQGIKVFLLLTKTSSWMLLKSTICNCNVNIKFRDI